MIPMEAENNKEKDKILRQHKRQDFLAQQLRKNLYRRKKQQEERRLAEDIQTHDTP